MAGQVDLNPKTNPLIDPLTLPGRDVGAVDFKQLFRAHPDELDPIVNLYLNYDQWGHVRSVANWAFSLAKKDEKTELLKTLPSITFTDEVQKLLHLKIVEQFAGKEAADLLTAKPREMKYNIAYSFAMLKPEDRTPENFKLIQTYKDISLFDRLKRTPRDIRAVAIKFFSATPTNAITLFNILQEYLYEKVDLNKFKLFVTKLIPFVIAGCKVEEHDGKNTFNPDRIHIRTKEAPILFFQNLRPQDMTEENLGHVLNLFQSLDEKTPNQQLDYETTKLDNVFAKIPEDNQAQVLGVIGPFLATFDQGQKQKMPVSIRTFIVYFVHLQKSQGTSDKDLMYSLYNLKKVLITIDFDPDCLRFLSKSLNYNLPEKDNLTAVTDALQKVLGLTVMK